MLEHYCMWPYALLGLLAQCVGVTARKHQPICLWDTFGIHYFVLVARKIFFTESASSWGPRSSLAHAQCPSTGMASNCWTPGLQRCREFQLPLLIRGGEGNPWMKMELLHWWKQWWLYRRRVGWFWNLLLRSLASVLRNISDPYDVNTALKIGILSSKTFEHSVHRIIWRCWRLNPGRKILHLWRGQSNKVHLQFAWRAKLHTRSRRSVRNIRSNEIISSVRNQWSLNEEMEAMMCQMHVWMNTQPSQFQTRCRSPGDVLLNGPSRLLPMHHIHVNTFIPSCILLDRFNYGSNQT